MVLLAGLFLAGCRTPPLRPVEIENEDMCEFCRMAISERNFAAEFLDRQGNARKFDSLNCLIRYLKARGGREQAAAIFVMDFGGKEWVRAEAARFVQSEKIQGPMGAGVAAFKESARAQEMAGRYGGAVVPFDDFWK